MRGRTVGTMLATAALILSQAACGQQPADTQGGATAETPTTQAATPVVQEGFKVTTASVGADELLGRFAEPDMRDRPLTRWWVPGSQMDEDEVEHEIESMVEAGFGGAEIVPVSTAGGDGEGELDWGSDEWKAITKHILEVARKHDFTIDFTMTPAWPLALPGLSSCCHASCACKCHTRVDALREQLALHHPSRSSSISRLVQVVRDEALIRSRPARESPHPQGFDSQAEWALTESARWGPA